MKRVNEPALVGLGAVLNQLDVDRANKYYGEYRGYGGGHYQSYGIASDTAVGSTAVPLAEHRTA
jgi:hypothetical protein